MADNVYTLIGQAMRKIGAVGKNQKNSQQGFMYRGIDAVMNALNPVMAELGLFIVPEVLEQTREERQTKNGNNLIYSILKIKYTLYAPDGSNVSAVVIGEGMDSGDKASNKALSVGLKYACFQIFMLPTEEMIDPDSEVHEVKPRNAVKLSTPATVTTTAKMPPADPVPPVLEYLAKEREALRVVRECAKAENNAIWKAQVKALTDAGLIPAKPLADFTQTEAGKMVTLMYDRFDPKGVALKDDGNAS